MMRYRPEIDGLRAVAVIPVILFHAGFTTFQGGFVGVDVFFVISGYLITSIILRQLEDGRFSLIEFYERRARRILPALVLVVAACVPAAMLIMTPAEAENFAESVAAVALFVSNILFWQESGYFETVSEEKPLLHTWSLAVEEQFYIFFPLFMLIIWANRRDSLVAIIVAISLISLALCEWGWRNNPGATFFLAPMRAWELLAGSLCAIAARRGTTEKDSLAALGVAMILASVIAFDDSTPFPSLFTLLPVGGTALVILFSGPRTVTGRLLSLRILVGLGLVSYSAYLWHQPLLAFSRLQMRAEPSKLFLIALIILTFALAYLSWRFVETPFRRTSGPRALPRRSIFTAAGVFSTAMIGIGVWGLATDGWRGSYQARLPEAERQMFALIEKARTEHAANADVRFDDGECVFDVRRFEEAVRARITECAGKYGPGILVLGDSHAIDLYGAVVASSRETEPFIVGIVSGGCRPHTPNPDCAYEALEDFLTEETNAFELAVFEQAGFYLLRGNGFEEGNRRMFNNVQPDAALPHFELRHDYISAIKSYLESLSNNVPIAWLTPRVEPHIPDWYIQDRGCEYEYQLRPGMKELFLRLDAAISDALSDSPVEFLSQQDLLRLSFPEDFLNCETLFWSDGDHFSNAGEARFGSRMRVLESARAVLGLRGEIDL